MLGTIMVGNVRFVIIPGQKDLVQAREAGRAPDPIHGIRGKQRSVHNTYFTLPVLFIMISNHYAFTFNHQYNWLILLLITLAGALVRVYFVKRHFGKASLVPLVVAALIMGGIVALTRPYNTPATTASATAPSVSLATISSIMAQRCASCHAEHPTQEGFASAPQGVLLETEAHILKHATAIYQQTVVSRAMPIGNLTGITEEERAAVGAWYLARSTSND